jgi:hypothetical protein
MIKNGKMRKETETREQETENRSHEEPGKGAKTRNQTTGDIGMW